MDDERGQELWDQLTEEQKAEIRLQSQQGLQFEVPIFVEGMSDEDIAFVASWYREKRRSLQETKREPKPRSWPLASDDDVNPERDPGGRDVLNPVTRNPGGRGELSEGRNPERDPGGRDVLNANAFEEAHPLDKDDGTEEAHPLGETPEESEEAHPLVISEAQVALTAEFGWGSAFLAHREKQGDLVIGVVDGRAVPFDTPGAELVFLVDWVEEAGLDSATTAGLSRISELYNMTQYQREVSVATANWDMSWHEAGSAGYDSINTQQEALLEPAVKIINGMIDYYGQEGNYSEEFINELAFESSRLGLLEDNEYMQDAFIAHASFDLMRSETSTSTQLADALRRTARTYFSDITEEQAREWVIEINSGVMTVEKVNELIRDQAAARYPELAGYIGDGQTVKSYFSTHQSAMEDMLGRPVNIYEEFPELYSSSAGVMNASEAQNLVRQTSEWRQSNNGQNTARLMTQQLAQFFGEEAQLGI